MSGSPTLGQIQAQVAAIRKKVPEARVIGIRAPARWTGPADVQGGDLILRIDQCDSPLEMREALHRPAGEGALRVLITPLDEGTLGEDLRLRLARGKLYSLDSWQVVRALFQANTVDPRLIRHSWMADTLIETLSAVECPPAPGGFLDAELVWPMLLERRIGLSEERPDLGVILQWSLDPDAIQRFRECPLELAGAASEWLANWAGPGAGVVLRCVLQGENPDAVPAGIAAGVIFRPGASTTLARAAGRFEARFLDGVTAPESVLQRWSAAAVEVVRFRVSPTQREALLARVDELLAELGAAEQAHLSSLSPLGYRQRISTLAGALRSATENLGSAPLEPQEAALESVRAHASALEEPGRLRRMEMAVRLARWLRLRAREAAPEPTSFAEAVRSYLEEGSWVDWARRSLRPPDTDRTLSDAYAALADAIRLRQEDRSRHFATLLRDWTAACSTGDAVVPVEQVLARVAAPLAAHAPLLVVVLDGLSLPVARELTSGRTGGEWLPGWKWVREAEREQEIIPGLAVIPSRTAVSRTSLLTGRRAQGAAAEERTGFARYPELLAHCRSTHPPLLFHKATLQEGSAQLSADLRDAIGSTQRRVVGVVVNAIDDQLSKGEQIDTHWTPESIPVLLAMLEAARSARRVVLLVSDHGHVLEWGMSYRAADGGERWRKDDGAPTAEEVRIQGTRVVTSDGDTLIVPWSERLRYAPKRNGYHGGANPQEMIAPVVVLCPATLRLPGWVEAQPSSPEWWEPAPKRPPQSDAPRPRAKRGKKPLTGVLFQLDEEVDDPPESVGSEKPDWIARLLASSLLQPPKRGITPDQLEVLLRTVSTAGGAATLAQLGKALRLWPDQMRETLMTAQRTLNLDGYPILVFDEATEWVRLDRDLLSRQFELDHVDA